MTELQEPTFAPGYGPNTTREQSADQQQDYFGFSATDRFIFPDGVTWIEFRKMNEGEKKSFQDKTSNDLVLERNTGNARMTVLQGSQRHELIKACVVDWNLKRGGEPVTFNKVQLGDFLTLSNPVIVEDLEKAIRKANPWLMAEMTAKDIQREIDNLEEMKAEAEKREAGEAS